MNKWVKHIFFGNYFYGVCAIGLSVEASLQQHFPLNDFFFYWIIFLATVWFYNVAYLSEKPGILPANERSTWYRNHYHVLCILQNSFGILLVLSIVFFAISYRTSLLKISFQSWIILASFPAAGMMYYGFLNFKYRPFSLRFVGWLKPFIIGYCWAGLVTVTPILYHSVVANSALKVNLFMVLLFIKNCMFISLLAILFDIKDYASDFNQSLKTFVVKKGLRFTIFYLIIPLSILGWGTFIVWGINHHFLPGRLIINTIPFVLLIGVAWSLHRRRSIFYYLVIIDGLMLAKAICGILATLFF